MIRNVHAALGGHRILASSSAATTGGLIRDRRSSAGGELLLADQFQVAAGLLGLAQIEQAGDHVQPVGELVLLGPQRVGQPGHRVHPPDQRLQLGPVAQGDDAADIATGHRSPAGG